MSPTPESLVAAITALGTLGDAAEISVLAKSATSANPAEQDAARLSLVQLRRGRSSRKLLQPDSPARPQRSKPNSPAPSVIAAIPMPFRGWLNWPAMEAIRDARRAPASAPGSLVDQPQLGSLVMLDFARRKRRKPAIRRPTRSPPPAARSRPPRCGKP